MLAKTGSIPLVLLEDFRERVRADQSRRGLRGAARAHASRRCSASTRATRLHARFASTT
jgi:hypothetical protein